MRSDIFLITVHTLNIINKPPITNHQLINLHRSTVDYMKYFPYWTTALSTVVLSAFAAEKHVHGEAELFIAIGNNQVMIELESPANNLLGFEHKPNNATQKKLLAESLTTLASYSSLVTVVEGNCKQTSSHIDSPFANEKGETHLHAGDQHESNDKGSHHHDKEYHGEKVAHDDHDDAMLGHSEFYASYTLNCSDSTAIKKIHINVFDNFKGFEKINMKWVANDQQGAEVVTPAKKQITLR